MDRREALKRIGLAMGCAVTPSVASFVLSGCKTGGTTAAAETLSAAQDEAVGTVAELIIPTTDTPGARAAGVNRFIDGVLTHAYVPEDRDRFLAGLADLDSRAERAHGNRFVHLTPEQQTALLTELEALSRQSTAPEQPFFSMIKELTLVGYYTSEIGATQELQWVHAAGRYDGDVPLSEAGRAYA